jgi:hypothetical protein
VLSLRKERARLLVWEHSAPRAPPPHTLEAGLTTAVDGAEGVIVVIDGSGAAEGAEGVAAIIAAVAALPAQVPLLLLVNKIDARGRSPQLAASLGPRPELVHTRPDGGVPWARRTPDGCPDPGSCAADRRRHPRPALAHPSEKDAKLAQNLGQLQPFIDVLPQECMGQLASFGPT